MVKIEMNTTERLNFDPVKQNSQLNRDEFTKMFVSRITTGAGATLIAFLGFSFSKADPRVFILHYQFTIWMLVVSLFSGMAASYCAAKGFSFRFQEFVCKENAQDQKAAAEQKIKFASIFIGFTPSIANFMNELTGKLFNHDYKNNDQQLLSDIYKLVDFSNFKVSTSQLVDDFLSSSLAGLDFEIKANLYFKYGNKLLIISCICFVCGVLQPLLAANFF